MLNVLTFPKKEIKNTVGFDPNASNMVIVIRLNTDL